MKVKNQVRVEFTVEGQPIPIDIGTFAELSEIQNVENKLPTLKFVFNDPTNLLHDLAPVTEGTKIGVVLHSDYGYDIGQAKETTYRVTGSKLIINGARLNFIATGIYDSVKYLGGVVKGAYKGTSSEVLAKLAGECSLAPKTAERTDDKMVWRPNSRQTYADFARHVCDHGHAGEKSIMSIAVTDRGQLVYKDLDTLAKAPSSKTVVSGSPDMITTGLIPAIGFEGTNLSGLNNFIQNYGTKLVQEKMEGAAQLFDKVGISSFSNFQSIDSGIKSAVGMVRSLYLPHDMGNQHEKFYDSENRNNRGRGSFNNKVEFVTANSTGIELYDVITFLPTIPNSNQISRLLAGNYIVAAKCKYLAGNHYFEKIQLMSQGYSQNYGGDLVGP